jgi:hypothetical protein
MNWRPFALLPQASVDAVQSAVRDAVARWCAAWGVPPEEVGLTGERAWEAAGRQPAWHDGRAAGAQSLWLAGGEDFAAQVQRLMYAPDRSLSAGGLSPLWEGAAAAAQDALLAALRDLLPAGEAPVARPSAQFESASGAVLVTLRCGRAAVHALFDHGAVQALAGLARVRQGGAAQPPARPAALAPVSHRAVLAPLPVRLEVALGAAQVQLGSLRALGVGDVIRLEQHAEQPLSVQGPQGVPLLAGYLGASEGQLALELAPHHINTGVKQ